MTAYISRVNVNLTDALWFAVRAGSYELKIPRVDFQTTASASSYHTYYLVRRFETLSMSGATSVPVVASRQGAPAASATASYSFTEPTGTSALLSYTTIRDIGTGSFQPPYDLTVSPGSAIAVNVGWQGSGQAAYINIPFEELRLSWSY